MSFAIGTHDGILFLARWIHFLAGITWIGVLYYFNFIQGEFFKEVEADTKNVAVQKLVPRALWWFRWGAMFTFLSGVALILGTMAQGMPHKSAWTFMISIGGLMGIFMWANVWFIIWPAQKVVIASTNSVLGGGKPDPTAAARGARAAIASRTNTLFSIPMLFFMGAARHLMMYRDFSQLSMGAVLGPIVLLIVLIEINAIKGKMGPMASVKGVIHCGLLLTAAIYLLLEIGTS